tara:strand:+ start:382 stop:828 length:447 start_codon:yes stop_codon:yes gene_type:complete
MKKIYIITDGACSGNPGPGGWGVIIKSGDHSKEFFDGDLNTTNNKMELTAAIKGFETLNEPCDVIVKTDSTYVINGITQWIHNWKKKGWINSAKKPVANKDLWEKLEKLISSHQVKWEWVKGHIGDIENERADELARNGIIKILNEES